MIKIDFSPFYAIDRDDATLHLAALVETIGADVKAQGRRFTAASYNNKIHAAYPLDNKSSFKRAPSIAKKIEGIVPMNDTDSVFSGGDLAKAIAYALVNEGAWEFPKTRDYVAKMPDPFPKLLQLPPASARTRAVQTAREEFKKVAEGSLSLSQGLHRIADLIAPIENENQGLRNKVDTQELTIIKSANENTKLVNAINEVKNGLFELSRRIDQEPDIDKKIALVNRLKDYTIRFESILS